MQQFIDESDAVDRDVLVHGNTIGELDTFLFYVVGDREPYAAALEATDMVTDFEITAIDDRSFYCFLTQQRNAVDEAMFDSFNRTGVIIVPPIEFLPDGVANLTVVGDGSSLQETLDEIPEAVTVTIQQVGDYDWRQALFDPELTDRQREAVTAAVEAGYYAVPRESDIEAIAATLDCAASTAAEHLRKAEQAVMAEYCGLHRYE
ncbi:helix-turn-helix domain-containing protein [Halohasta salina]|uniref:helix-turn-helix domain-containing protein n=1 Tax=Halohasta salina TaxID=2961621 RepID=UPI0020A3C500|nr:helix-turn-helix domain-containing protein [Halohasta salina]